MRGANQQVIVEQVHARHILMKPNELQDDATVRQKLAQIRERIVEGRGFRRPRQDHAPRTRAPAAEGGDLGWTDPGTFVPEFEQVLATLKENEISQPFRTQFGWHIVQLLGRRQFDNTDELKRRHAAEAIRASRADEETELWMRRLRDEAYVEYKALKPPCRASRSLRASLPASGRSCAWRSRANRWTAIWCVSRTARCWLSARSCLASRCSLRDYDAETRVAHVANRLRVDHHPLGTRSVPGKLDKRNARYVLALLDRAIDGAMSGEFDAIVTAPVHKSVINDAGVPFTGPH